MAGAVLPLQMVTHSENDLPGLLIKTDDVYHLCLINSHKSQDELNGLVLQIGVNAFHEKAGMSQVCFSLFSLFLPVDSFRSSRAASVAILPSALLFERFSLGAWWAFPIQ